MAFGTLTLFFGLLLDRIIGDPAGRFHPVALLGNLIGCWGKANRYPEKYERAAGICGWLVTVAVCLLPCVLICLFAPVWVTVIFSIAALAFCIGWRSLEEHVKNVESALGRGDEEGRRAVSLMISRDTKTLTTEQIRSGAYESAAENLTDSIIAPVFWFVVFELLFGTGICGAVLFRAANTMDAMLGYRDERIRIGWFSARMDDILAYLPARVTGLLLIIIYAVCGKGKKAFSVFLRDRKKRPGFNGGIPMSLIAGGCGIQFEKPGVYKIGNRTRTLKEGGPAVISSVRAASLFAAVIGMVLMFFLRTQTPLFF